MAYSASPEKVIQALSGQIAQQAVDLAAARAVIEDLAAELQERQSKFFAQDDPPKSESTEAEEKSNGKRAAAAKR